MLSSISSHLPKLKSPRIKIYWYMLIYSWLMRKFSIKLSWRGKVHVYEFIHQDLEPKSFLAIIWSGVPHSHWNNQSEVSNLTMTGRQTNWSCCSSSWCTCQGVRYWRFHVCALTTLMGKKGCKTLIFSSELKAEIKIYKLLESNQISSSLFVPRELVFPKIVKVGEIQ